MGLLVYIFSLRSALQQFTGVQQERDQAIQKAIRLEAELDAERKQGLGRIESLNEAKEALTLSLIHI